MDIYEYIKEYTTYEKGRLYWSKIPKFNHHAEIGKEIGCIASNGYKVAMINNRGWSLHRLIYLYHNKELNGILDHVDRNKTNNNIENLRIVTHSQNLHNQNKHKNNTSGYIGVYYKKRDSKWVAQIRVNSKCKEIGTYLTAKEASIARETYKQILNIFKKGKKLMDLVQKAGTIMVVAEQLNTIFTEAWAEWDVEGNELKDDEQARVNFLRKKLQPHSKQLTNTLNLLKTRKVVK